MQTSRPQGAKPSWTLAPWFDSDWPVLCRECRKLERRYRRTERKVDHAAFFAALCNKHAKFATKQNQYWSEWTSADAGCSAKLWRSPSKILRRDDNSQGSHYLLILKFNDFSRTFKDPQISFSRTNSRRKFTAWAVEQQYLMFMYVMMVQLLRNKTWYYLANVDSGNTALILHNKTQLAIFSWAIILCPFSRFSTEVSDACRCGNSSTWPHQCSVKSETENITQDIDNHSRKQQ